jgi:hypothetical protein
LQYRRRGILCGNLLVEILERLRVLSTMFRLVQEQIQHHADVFQEIQRSRGAPRRPQDDLIFLSGGEDG